MRGWIGLGLGVLLCPVRLRDPDDRRASPFPADEHREGSRTRTPARASRRRGLVMPDQFTVDRPGKCEVRCVREGRSYKCKEYRC